MLCFAAGVALEEKLDGDGIGSLSALIAIGGGALAGFAAYVSEQEKKSKGRRGES